MDRMGFSCTILTNYITLGLTALFEGDQFDLVIIYSHS